MANQFIFTNFFASELVGSIGVSDTAINIPPTDAAKIQAFSPASSQVMQLVLWDGQNPPEIVQCTNNPQTGTLTVVRAQEGTSAFAWSVGTQVRSCITAGVLNAALAAYNSGQVLTANYLPLTGGTLTGALLLSGAPTVPLQAATKSYVDGIGGTFLQTTGGTMTGNISMSSGARIIGLPAPVVATEPATKSITDTITSNLTNFEGDVQGETTTGTSTAYVLTTVSGAAGNGIAGGAITKVSFIAHIANAGASTMAVDGQPAKPLRISPGIEIPPNTLLQNTPYAAVFVPATGELILQGVTGVPFTVPVGAMVDYIGGATPNSNFIIPQGQILSQTTYAVLFNLIGSTYNTGGEGAGNFRIPDLRGRVVAQLDAGAGRIGTINLPADATDNPGGTLIGNTIGSHGGSPTHTQVTGEVGQHLHGITDPGHLHAENGIPTYSGNQPAGGSAAGASGGSANTNSAVTNITINNSAAPSAMTWIQPTIMLNKLLRII